MKKILLLLLIGLSLFNKVSALTQTASTTAVTRIISTLATTNFVNSCTAGNFTGSDRRCLLRFVIPAGSGTITQVTMKLFTIAGEIRTGGTEGVYNLTQKGW